MADGVPVLQLLGPSTGGIRRHVAHLAETLRHRGWQVETAGPAGVLDGLAPLDHVVEIPAGVGPGGAWRARSGLARAVEGTALVHAHGLKAGWLATSLRRRPPVVVTVHNLVLTEVAGPAAWPLQRLEALLPRVADATVATSAEVARRFAGAPGADRIAVVPPAWPPPRARRPTGEVRAELGLGPGHVLLVTAARLHLQKGLDVLLDAVALLRGRRPEVRCAVAGEGPLEATLRRRVDELRLAEEVLLTGARDDMADLLAAADVVVIPSRWESGPLVLFEALALGRPVVSTPVGAAPSLLADRDGDGCGGRLVAVDDPAALAEAVAEVLDDPKGAAAMAVAGRRRVAAAYGDDVLIAPLEARYRALTANRCAAGA
ncbi:MAG TPA: glycosyltransferase family 4 protein [Acidimicrobiales bacterium]|nr:glycosyltransferase family 4 protein [Acidimicrobiales bacterium]